MEANIPHVHAAATSVYMSDSLLDEVVQHLLQRLKEGQKGTKPDALRSYVSTVGHIRWGGCMIYMRVKIKRGIEL